jgi:hypothetical protein
MEEVDKEAKILNDKENIKKLLLSLKEQYGEYHRHKENMAWVATVLYLGFIFGIIKFVSSHNLGIIVRVSLVVIILITATILFYYIKEQLKNRRYGAYIVDACSSLSFKLLDEEYKFKECDFKLCKGKIIDRAIFPHFLQKEIDKWSKEEHASINKFERSQWAIIIFATIVAILYIISYSVLITSSLC